MKNASITGCNANRWAWSGSRFTTAFPFALLALGTLLGDAACGPDESCAETATCSPTGSSGDASAESSGRDGSLDQQNTSDVPDAGRDLGADTERDNSVVADTRTSDQARTDSASDGSGRGGSGAGGADGGTDARIPDESAVDVALDSAEDGPSTADRGGGADAQLADTSNSDTSDADGILDVVTDCTSSTCPTGCCDTSNHCVTTPSHDACGGGGAMCQACGAGQECNGTSCVCTSASCTSGCCNGTACVPFAQQSDTQCGAAKTCGSCAATMQSCDKSNGQCTCTAASCMSGCCSGTTCRPYADQDATACGVSGACTTCGAGQKCNGSGACVAKTWCESQTVPAGVALADYQCVDFDNGALPSAWTLTQMDGGLGAVSMTQANSVPYSFHSNALGTDGLTTKPAGTLSWSKSGTAVARMDLAADIFRIQSKGDPGAWTGHSDLLCAGFGSTKTCLYYAGAAGFRVAYAVGTTRVDCDDIIDLGWGQPGSAGGWNHIEFQVSTNGSINLWLNGALVVACSNGGVDFPSSTIGTATVGVAQDGETLDVEHYFDNIVAIVRR